MFWDAKPHNCRTKVEKGGPSPSTAEGPTQKTIPNPKSQKDKEITQRTAGGKIGGNQGGGNHNALVPQAQA